MSDPATPSTPVIRTEHVSRVLDGEVPITLVDDVSLQIEQGEFVCIMGPSGSGKSSLLYLMGLLDVPTHGQVFVDGQDTSSMNEDQLAGFRLLRLGYVFQFHFLLQEFSALDNVALPMRKLNRYSADEAHTRAAELLDRFGLNGQHQKHPSQMSGGQRQRVAIARAMANDPLVILADEPTGNLDSVSSANVRDILRELTRESGKSVVAVTHDGSFASVADRRIGLVDGRIDMDWRPGRMA